MKITAGQIQELLAVRHAQDVWVPECNLGAAMHGARRIDGWALRKTWSPMTTVGYEIKVSRGDWMRDTKWQEYLPYCHELYLVCPRGLIEPEELPADVGLLWISANARKAYAKRRAVRREPDPQKLTRLMAYVLMSRSRIVGDMHAANAGEAVDYWRQWLLDQDGKRYIGHMVSYRVAERLRLAEREKDEALRKVATYQAVQDQLRSWGIDPEEGIHAIREHLGDQTEHLRERLRRAASLGRQLTQLTEGH